MKLGFTGTRAGMTSMQMETVERLLEEIAPEEVHHGDCIGSDEEFHATVREVLPTTTIYIHPPQNMSKRAYCEGDFEHKPLPYLERNHKIVDDSHALLATPSGYKEVLISGTGATIRYAKKIGRRVIIVFPDGSVEDGPVVI